MKSLNNFKALVPNFISNLVDTKIVTLIQVVEKKDRFETLSYDSNLEEFIIGTVYKKDDEDSCFEEGYYVDEDMIQGNETLEECANRIFVSSL